MSKSLPDRRSHQAGVPVLDWLHRNPQGMRILQTAHELLALEATLAHVLPTALARGIRVAQVEGPVVTIMVPGAAHAARLRQLAQSAATRLQEAGWPIERIVVRIDARSDATPTQTPNRETRPLNTQALEAFEALGQKVAPGPLAEAISRLLLHHRG